MVASLDGYIAKNDGSVGWMDATDHYAPGKILTQDDITQFLASVDCYIMGSHTYEHAVELGWPYGDVPVFVFTRRALKSKKKTVEFLSGDLTDMVNHRIKPHYQNIWMVGGSYLAKDFLRSGLADEINITLIPILLGNGIRFFREIGREAQLHLKDVSAYQDGTVELCYEIKKNEQNKRGE